MSSEPFSPNPECFNLFSNQDVDCWLQVYDRQFDMISDRQCWDEHLWNLLSVEEWYQNNLSFVTVRSMVNVISFVFDRSISYFWTHLRRIDDSEWETTVSVLWMWSSDMLLLKGHSGTELHIYFLVHLESIYYEIFFYSKIVPNCTVAK